MVAPRQPIRFARQLEAGWGDPVEAPGAEADPDVPALQIEDERNVERAGASHRAEEVGKESGLAASPKR